VLVPSPAAPATLSASKVFVAHHKNSGNTQRPEIHNVKMMLESIITEPVDRF
jgi:hypothetical protein